MFTVEQIAEVCHEANRVLTYHVRDVPVQPSWLESPEENAAQGCPVPRNRGRAAMITLSSLSAEDHR